MWCWDLPLGRHIPSSSGHHRPKQKLVKDPNLVGALSGHKEGSRAFNRYRDIEIDMKRDLVKILEDKRWCGFLFDWYLTESLKTAFDSEFIANLQ